MPRLSLPMLGLALGLTSLTPLAADKPDLTRLQEALGDVTPDSVRPAPLPGLYEVIVDGRLLYLSEDGRFAMQGDVIDLERRTNLTEVRLDGLRKQAVDAVGEDHMLIFKPKEIRHVVTIFTDVDCGYCRKLHREMQTYLERGIEIRYLFFPRTGLGTESHGKAVAVWCADDRQQAITRAKQGQEIERRDCPNPVAQHYKLGIKVGVQGTPAIVLENGRMLPGYVPAEQLAQILDEQKSAAALE
ncbi:MAG TPA: DsbC family protein [Candidatus Competibacteraceae bacterium]|nr:DsbC family protein [Candidatus Competibacteraceae bacterium]